MQAMFIVSLRIVDSATQKPLPVRLRIYDREGRTYAPLGRLTEFATGRNEDVGGHLWLGEPWCYIDGTCEVPLPAGVSLSIEARHGPEYLPLRHEVTLGPGQMALRLAMERFVNYHSKGWYSGDARCHFLSPHAALLEGTAEGLDVVNLLVRESQIAARDRRLYPALPNMVAFSGQQPALERDAHLVAVNTFHTHPVLGQLSLLHCHRAVFPLSFGGADQTDDWALADWCDQCHRKKGLVVWSDAFRFENGMAAEALADLILGRIDAIECTPTMLPMDEIYDSWEAGIRFPLVGASGKDSNSQALGGMRTYAYVQRSEVASAGSPLRYSDWIEAVRSGATFITSGPMLQLTVNGQPPGSVLDLDEGTKSVRVQARLDSALPCEPLEMHYNGRIVGHSGDSLASAPCSVSLDLEVPVSANGWIAACCQGQTLSGGFAQTSPVFIRGLQQSARIPAIRQNYIEALRRTAHWVETAGRFEKPKRKEQLIAILKQAEEALLARLA